MTKRAGRRKPSVIRASPVGQRTPGRTSACRRQACRSSGPAARWIAPSAPPPPSICSLAAFAIASTSSLVMAPRSSTTALTLALADVAGLEMRMLDDAEAVAEWILDRADDDAVADVMHGLDAGGPELQQAIEHLARVRHAPECLYAMSSGLPVRQEAEFEPADREADVERLVEIRLHAKYFAVPRLRARESGRVIDRRAQTENHVRPSSRGSSVLARRFFARPDPETRGRYQDLAQESEQADEKRQHRDDEENGHRERGVEPHRGAEEENRDHGAHQQRRDRAERDRAPRELGTPRQGRELLVEHRRIARMRFEPLLERPGPVDDPREPLRHDSEHRADAGQEEYGRNRKRDDVRDRGDARVSRHWRPPPSASRNAARRARSERRTGSRGKQTRARRSET